MKTEDEIRAQLKAQRAYVASLELELKAAKGLIGGLMFALGEIVPEEELWGRLNNQPANDADIGNT